MNGDSQEKAWQVERRKMFRLNFTAAADRLRRRESEIQSSDCLKVSNLRWRQT
jgi:hypothetical protein